jgi:tetrapyrrole methylase family protein/MazG family protein
MKITIVGLGPGNPDLLTRKAWEVLTSSDEVFFRTNQHPVVSAIPKKVTIHSFDAVYQKHESFEQVYREIVERVLELGRRPEGVVYAVPGHPNVGEATTPEIARLAGEQGIEVEIIPGVSFLEPTASAIGIDLMDGSQVVDAMLLARDFFPVVLPEYPLIIAQCYSKVLASDVKMSLMAFYPDEHPLVIVNDAGGVSPRVTEVKLFELDRVSDFGHTTTLYVPPLEKAASYESLQKIVARLRAPGGCPWDRKQTHESLRNNLLEETYEVLEALDSGDTEKLQEELGDLLLQAAMHVQIASEEGEFKLPDVISTIVEKLIRRHPHVFGDVEVSGVEEVLQNWEEIKKGEREHSGDTKRSFLDGVPSTLPALAQAQAYITRARRKSLPINTLVDERTVSSLIGQPTPERLGELLWAIAAWADSHDVDAESALRDTNLRKKEELSDLDARTKFVV